MDPMRHNALWPDESKVERIGHNTRGHVWLKNKTKNDAAHHPNILFYTLIISLKICDIMEVLTPPLQILYVNIIPIWLSTIYRFQEAAIIMQ